MKACHIYEWHDLRSSSVRYNSWVVSMVPPHRLLKVCLWDCERVERRKAGPGKLVREESISEVGGGGGAGGGEKGGAGGRRSLGSKGAGECRSEFVMKRLYDKILEMGVRGNLTFSRRFHELIDTTHGDPWRLLGPAYLEDDR